MFFLLMVALMSPSVVSAQDIMYIYDAAGNRVLRTCIPVQNSPQMINTQIKDLEDDRILSVGPNPTSGILYVRLPHWNDNDEYRLLLSNMSGQVLIEKPMKSIQTILDLSNYPNGYYLLKVNFKGEQATYKIIKTNKNK